MIEARNGSKLQLSVLRGEQLLHLDVGPIELG